MLSEGHFIKWLALQIVTKVGINHVCKCIGSIGIHLLPAQEVPTILCAGINFILGEIQPFFNVLQMRNYWHHPSIHFGRAAKYRSAIFIFYLTQIYWNTDTDTDTHTHTHTRMYMNTYTRTHARTHQHKYAHTQWEYQELFVKLCEHLPIHNFLVWQNNIARSQLPAPPIIAM